MIIGSPKEIAEGEKRVAMTPDSALQLQKLGFDCVIESGAGADAGFTDVAYERAGVQVVKPQQRYGRQLMLLPRCVASTPRSKSICALARR